MNGKLITAFVDAVNIEILKKFVDGNAVAHGIAVTQRKISNEQNIFFPTAQIKGSEEMAMIAPNDMNGVEFYHRSGNVTMAGQGSGYGRKTVGLITTTYTMAVIGFLNTIRLKNMDESYMVMLMSSALTFDANVKGEPGIQRISVQPTGGNINSDEIATAEYRVEQNPFSSAWRLFRVNYNIQMLYDPSCVVFCK